MAYAEMGEVSHLKVSVPKPRPLGLVKRESVHFDNEEDDSNTLFSGKHGTWTPGSLAFFGRSKTEGDIKHEFRSMRDLQETLRQAALLNIVAAVNHDESAVDSVPTTRTHGSHFVGIKGASILGHPITRPNTKQLASTATGEGITINNFSHNLATTASTMPVASHNSTLSQLLGQRPRTISIPGPRAQTEQGAFYHNNLLDAKERLSNVTTFRARSRKEMDSLSNQNTPAAAPMNSSMNSDETKANQDQSTPVESKNSDFVREVSCLRGTAFDTLDSGQQSKPVKDSMAQHNNITKESNTNQNGDGNSGRLSKDQQRAQNVHQMQAMKRHISTSKKKELMKKLTDIAKCEAVDIAEPISSSDGTSAPPIIIMSQQKESFPVQADELDTRVNRTKSMTSLHGRGEESHVPANTRIQSETLESMATYREAKKKAHLSVGEDLKIESINGIDSSVGVDGLYRANRDQRLKDYAEYMHNSPDSRTDQLFSESIIGRPAPSYSPDFLELRPLESSPHANGRPADRRRPPISRRGVSQSVRDKLISPSPAVYEASFHRPKASVQMTLVGQSLPALSGPKVSSTTPTKPAPKRLSGDFGKPSSREENQPEEGPSKQLGENKAIPLKPWGSIGKQPSVNSPILRTEILDHLQCVGLVNHRQLVANYKKSKANGAANRGHEFLRRDSDFGNEEYYYSDDEEGSDTQNVTKNTAKYRKSKLYSAFRASEENLANLVDNSCVSEAITSRTLLNQTNQPTVVDEETDNTPRKDPVNQSSKEPLYMGCSSRVSERELRSQYHYVNDLGEEDNKHGQFKVMKAIDQDAYFDFQHKKYRKNNETPLNTAENNPRMHFLKIKFGGEAKT